MLSRFFINRPIFAAVVSILIVILGVAAMMATIVGVVAVPVVCFIIQHTSERLRRGKPVTPVEAPATTPLA